MAPKVSRENALAYERNLIRETRALAHHHARIGMPANKWVPPWVDYWNYEWEYAIAEYNRLTERVYDEPDRPS